MLCHHCFSVLLWSVPLGKSRKIKSVWNWMGHISWQNCFQ